MADDQKLKKYDLESRTAKFGEDIILFAKKVPRNIVTIPLVGQLVNAGTSVGANYCEADDAESKKDFKHKIGICKKEARETKHWLRMIAVACPELKEEARRLWQEAKELNLIFNAISKKV
ncbi:MAG: four helix bundle protein [Patescibacteria group bacterium]